MDHLRLHAVAARVVAWHNRHPLARRITAAQVQAVGYVALPFATGAPGAMLVEPALEAAAPATPQGHNTSDTPDAAAAGGSLRERALARARQQADAAPPAASLRAAAAPAAPPARPAMLRAAFSEDFINPLKPHQVARWAARHGQVLEQTPSDAPLRAVEGHGPGAGQRPVTLYVLTAAIEVGNQRHRVLLAGGDDPAVLGRRLLSRPRIAGFGSAGAGLLAAVGAGVAAAAGLLHLPLPGGGAGAAPTAGVAASAAVTAADAPASPDAAHDTAPAAAHPETHAQADPAQADPAEAHRAEAHPAETAGSAGLQAGAPAAAPADPQAEPHAGPHDAAAPLRTLVALRAAPASAAATTTTTTTTSPPLDVEARLGRVDMPSLRPMFSDDSKAAARQARAGSAAPDGYRQTAATSAPTSTPDPASAAAAPVAAAAPATAFAVSTRVLRTRAEAEQVAAAMQALLQTLAGPGAAPPKVDLLPQGDDWRVVGWPYAQREAADKARTLLGTRGMRVEVLAF